MNLKEEIKYTLFQKENLIQLPDNGGSVFRTQEVMRAITKYENLIDSLSVKEGEYNEIHLLQVSQKVFEWINGEPSDKNLYDVVQEYIQSLKPQQT